MTKILAIINQKGGVGKSTITVNLAYEFSQSGKKTLIIDLDPQAHSSVIYCPEVKSDNTIKNAFLNPAMNIKSLCQPAYSATDMITNLSIIPSSIHLALSVEQISGKIYREKILKNHLERIKKDFDIVLLDCPPTLGIIAVNAVYAADLIIIPTNYGKYSLDGIGDLLESINLIKEENFKNYFILRNMYELRNSQTNLYVHDQLSQIKDHVLDTIIKKRETINQSQIAGIPLKKFDQKSKSSIDFETLSVELMKHVA